MEHAILDLPMPALSESHIAQLLVPYLPEPSAVICSQLSAYLDLLLKWNARTNLTAIRDPDEIVRRHFGESLFAAQHLDAETSTLLDFGSGAGFPGLPMALLRPDIAVTLAESQNKKASFLREVVRTLGISVEIWPKRVESMPEASRFHTVALRAVDNMTSAITSAHPRAAAELILLTSARPILPATFAVQSSVTVPNSLASMLFIGRRIG